MVVYENILLKFSQNFLSKAWLKKNFLIDNNYKNFFVSVRMAYSSYTVGKGHFTSSESKRSKGVHKKFKENGFGIFVEIQFLVIPPNWNDIYVWLISCL